MRALAALSCLVAALVGCLEYGPRGAPCTHDDDCSDGLTCVVPSGEAGVCLAERPLGCRVTVDVSRDVVLRNADDIAALAPPEDERCLRIEGSVSLTSTSLTSLEGLERVVEITGDLIARENDSLRDLAGLAGLLEVGGRVEILENHALTAVGLPELRRAGEIWLTGTSNLTSLAGLSALERVDGRLWLANHAALRDLGTLPQLSSLAALDVEDNPALVDLAGLAALETVDGALGVSRNSLLPTLAGLSSLDDVGATLSIEDNPLLPTCEALALASQVSPSTTSVIGNDDAAVCP